MRSRSGVDITGAFGFFALLRKTHRELAPGSEIAVCFDSETAPNPRRDLYPDYKSWLPVPDELTPFAWFPSILEGLDLLSVPWCEVTSYEADDAIASLAAGAVGRRVAVASADHDFVQLVDRRVRVITPWRMFTVAAVVERFSVHPSQWCDYRALTGDKSDSIPGIHGIGPKRAAYLLHGRRALENARIPDTWWGRRVLDTRNQALTWRDLIRLRTDLGVSIEPTAKATLELPRAAEICERLGLWQ